MIRDNALSEQRAIAGKRGADATNNRGREKPNNSEDFADDFAEATDSANTESENENINETKTTKKSIPKKFIKPTIDEINSYCLENNFTLNADKFFNYYESKGWVVGKSPMKSWQAAIRNWVSNNNPPPIHNPIPQEIITNNKPKGAMI